MKILGQKVARATLEVDGLVQGRIGSGLVLMLGMRENTSFEDIKHAAAKVTKLKLWPDTPPGEEISSPPKMVNVVDKGYEVLVLLQPSLCASFRGPAPSSNQVMEASEAQLLFQDFVQRLQQQYQEEMVVAGPVRGHVRVESTFDGEIFDLSELTTPSVSRDSRNGAVPGRAPVKDEKISSVKTETVTKPPPLKADVTSMTRALKLLKNMSRTKRDLASAQMYRIMGLPKFQESLIEANEITADSFAEALEEASPYFSKEQQEQITDWTGLMMASPPQAPEEAPKIEPAKGNAGPTQEEEEIAEEELQAEVSDEALKQQLEDLREEARDPKGFAAKKAAASKAAALKPAIVAKQEPKPQRQATQPGPTKRPEGWRRPAEPQRPPQPRGPPPGYVPPRGQMTTSIARVPVPQGKGKGKGKGKGGSRRAVGGIVSLDESARLHGMAAPKESEAGQFQRFKADRIQTGTQAAGTKRSAPAAGGPVKLVKGTPTLAPMTPAPEDSWDSTDEKKEDDFTDI